MKQQDKNDDYLIKKNMYHDAGSRKQENMFLISLGAVLVCLVLDYFFVYAPFMDVLNHVEKVDYVFMLMFFAPFCTVLALYSLLCRKSGLGGWKSMEPIDKLIFSFAFILAISSSLGATYWFWQLLNQHGYIQGRYF